MGILTVAVCFVAVLAMVPLIDGGGECPMTGQVYSCSPKCLQNSDCTYGKLCCTNQCHTKSCVEPKTSGSSGYKETGYTKNARYSSRIVGGKAASITDHPHSALVYFCDPTDKSAHVCGGAIIGIKWILTAAHCPGNVTSEPKVYVGSDEMYEGTLYQVKKSVRHDLYENVLGIKHYDIMVLELSKNLKFGCNVEAIALGKDTDLVDKAIATIAGFGYDRDPNDPNIKTTACGLMKKKLKVNSKLLAVELPIITHDSCRAVKRYEGLITDSDFCAGYVNKGKGTCVGDSGSALVRNGRIIGIASGALEKCGRERSIFVSVPLTKAWILGITGKL